jgi:hypothetical protein
MVYEVTNFSYRTGLHHGMDLRDSEIQSVGVAPSAKIHDQKRRSVVPIEGAIS